MDIVPAGLGKRSRERLGRLLRQGQPILTPAMTAKLLSLSRAEAANQLARWERAGWLARVRRGAYVPVPLQASSPNIVLEDPWVIAANLYAPCYIAGWSAAEHWGLTEQVFRSVCVITAAPLREREQSLRGTRFTLHTTREGRFFGLKTVWRGTTKVQVSDPARTVIDMLSDPRCGGGIRSVADMLAVYLQEHRDSIQDLVEFGERLGNGAVFKRLGFLLSQSLATDDKLIAACRERLSAGYAKLDPQLLCNRLVTAWKLWIPKGWKRQSSSDRAR